MKRFLLLIFCVVVLFSIFQLPVSTVKADNTILPAFPGAEGFGYAVEGGRGGEVYHVTSYELTGPGTFHDALMTAGDTPRTIVFDISGNITIPKIVVKNKSNITIAGQTAPGDGVTIQGNTVRFIDSSDIIIRFMRFRLGQHKNFADDSMYIKGSQNVIIDHCSFSWGTDEVLSIKKSENITVQWSIISEGLLTHSMGGLIEMNTITMHHNLYAHNNDRNPKTKGQIDFVNNIIYNWGQYPYVAGGESGTKGYGNVVGNYFIAAKNSANPEYAIVRGNENYSLYLNNNHIDSNKNGILDGADTGTDMIEVERPAVVVPDRFEYPLVNTEEPEDAYQHVLGYSGASLVRDAVDKRVIDDVRDQTGVIIGHENDVGGFPSLKQGAAPDDADRDGIPDEWELAKGLDPNDSEDRNGDTNGNGYTDLEDYLNELAVPSLPTNYPKEPPEWSGPVFTPPTPEPTPDPMPEPKESMDGEILRNVVINDNSSKGYENETKWSVQESLQVGDLVAGDRISGGKAYKFVTIPDELKGMEWIRSAVNSRSSTSNDLLSFYLAADADVYVAYDSRIDTEPEWLTTSYEDTGEIIEDDQPVKYKLYKKHYFAGDFVVTGANNNTSKMNYFVILKPTNSQENPPANSPSGLTGELLQDNSVSLKWSPVSGADAYILYRSSSKDSIFRAVASSETAEYVDTTVELGATYNYKVSALSAGGESPQSETVEVFSYDSTQPKPSAPTELSIPTTKSITVVLDWTPVDGTISYGIYRSTEPDGPYKEIGNSTTAGYTDKTASPSTTYYYKVSTIGIGGESERSGSVSTTTKSPVTIPEVPVGLSAGVVTNSAFEIQWNSVEGAESYNIYRKANEENIFVRIDSTISASYVDEGISVSNTGYSYKISAVNEMGETEQSDELTVAMPVPSTPSDLKIGLVGESFVGLIWTSHGGTNQYNIYREADGVVQNLGYAKVDTYYDRTVEPGVEYTYYIKAQNASGESDKSNIVKVTPGLITVLGNYMEQYRASDDLTGPIISQLSNTLKQAKHHREKGSKQQAIKFMQKYLDQLSQKKKENHISSEAKMNLSHYAQLYIDKLEEGNK